MKKTKIKILKEQLEDLWKAVCMKRDNYKCQYCGSDKDLQVHHIISRRNMNTKFDIDNGITLCKRCHSKISLNSTAYIEFMIWYIKKFGVDKLENLKNKARETKKYTISELEEKIKQIKELLNVFHLNKIK